MNIREATLDDAAAIAKVHVESWRTTYQGILPDEFLAGFSYDERELLWREVITSSRRSVYVAENEREEIIGFVSGGRARDRETLYDGELDAIYLLAPYQRNGIGRQLVVALATRLIEQDIRSLLVWVLAVNPARKFYERLGGQLIDQKPTSIGGESLIEVAYGWRDAHKIIKEFGQSERR